jgi:putative polyhydroxyalkanoate system protein
MAVIEITRKHNLTIEELKKRAENLAKENQAQFGFEWRWHNSNQIALEAKSGVAKGAHGAVTVSPETVKIQIELVGFVQNAAKGMVEKFLADNIDKYLA